MAGKMSTSVRRVTEVGRGVRVILREKEHVNKVEGAVGKTSTTTAREALRKTRRKRGVTMSARRRYTEKGMPRPAEESRLLASTVRTDSRETEGIGSSLLV